MTNIHDFRSTGAATPERELSRGAGNDPRAEAKPRHDDSISKKLCGLLGPLVGPLWRDADGALAPSRIRAKDFEEFKKFLQDQIALDGIAFNEHLLASYHKVLDRTEYEPLLRGLWEEAQGREPDSSLPPAVPDFGLLHRFTADLVAVSAERFVHNNLGSREGRQKLRHILGDPGSYTKGMRADLVKAIAMAGEERSYDTLSAYRSDDEISSWNYFNQGVSDEELGRATRFAKNILEDADWHEAHLQKLRKKYAEEPAKVRTLPPNLDELDRKIKPERIRAVYSLYENHRLREGALSELKAHLANFWLMCADSDYWIQDNHLGGHKTRTYLVNHADRFLERAKKIRTAEEFISLNEELNEFLHGPLNAEGSSTWNWLKHKTVGHGLADLFAETTQDLKAPYSQLLQLSDEILHSVEMGEHILIHPPTGESPSAPFMVAANFSATASPDAASKPDIPATLTGEDPGVAEASRKLVQELEKAKRQLWYGYKQHKAISRLGSQIADVFAAGDIADIREANGEIDRITERLAKTRTKEDLRKEVERLSTISKEGGVLYQAYEAAEMDGIEQLIGLTQTIAIIIGTTLITDGLGTAGAMANATRATTALRSAGFTARAAHGMRMGAWISFAENEIAVVSGEVRQKDDTVLSWGKDSLASGMAMGLFTPLAARVGHSAEKNILQRLSHRYTKTPLQGFTRFGGDTALEAAEEIFDAGLRQGLEGEDVVLSWDRLRELALIAGAGGGFKIGAIAEGFRKSNLQLKTSDLKSPEPGDRGTASPAAGEAGPLCEAALRFLGGSESDGLNSRASQIKAIRRIWGHSLTLLQRPHTNQVVVVIGETHYKRQRDSDQIDLFAREFSDIAVEVTKGRDRQKEMEEAIDDRSNVFRSVLLESQARRVYFVDKEVARGVPYILGASFIAGVIPILYLLEGSPTPAPISHFSTILGAPVYDLVLGMLAHRFGAFSLVESLPMTSQFLNQRNRAMVENTVAIMNQTEDQPETLLMVVGLLHVPHMVALFKENGFEPFDIR